MSVAIFPTNKKASVYRNFIGSNCHGGCLKVFKGVRAIRRSVNQPVVVMVVVVCTSYCVNGEVSERNQNDNTPDHTHSTVQELFAVKING